MKSAILSFLALAALTFPAQAISIAAAGSAYTQDFDALASPGTNNAWTNNSTLPGWSLFQAGGTTTAAYNIGNGSSNTGAFYSYGATAGNDRALGGLGVGAYFGNPIPGAIAGWMAVSFSNGSGGSFDGFAVSWDGEQWRNGGNASAQTMVFEYGFGDNFTGVSNWFAPGESFNFASVVNTVNSATVDGNTTGLVAGRGGAVSSLSWAATDTLWLRWAERNDAGNDHGLAIDNFSFTASRTSASVPDGGTTFAMFGLSCAGLAGLRRKSAGK
ncbi:MAG: VPDSG-CTERM sorting domain-containing protein [Verrucomicrobiota bacterium]